ncbi:MAG: type II secretion system F family protein [Oscillospiraceae bacterium]|nr:type II secretion system F family protein [Oscillospiraceae bacterium]
MKKPRLKNEDIAYICHSLKQLYHAGTAPGDAFMMLSEDEVSEEGGRFFAQMSAMADEGTALHDVFRRTECFPHYVCSLLEVGGRAGKTEEALGALAMYYEGRSRQQRQLKVSLLYPAVLLAVLLAVVVILLAFVLPVFNDVYAQLGASLTGVAGGLLMFGNALRKALPVICVILALALIFAIIMAVSPGARDTLSKKWIKSRSDKGMWRKVNEARFLQALSMALSSGFDHREAAELAMELSRGTEKFELRCKKCLELVSAGAQLSAALREAGILSKADCRLIETGMRSGMGEEAVARIARLRLEESEEALEAGGAMVEPVIVIVMCVIVGAILLSVMLPLMNIMSAIG